ncbi:MAG: class IIb bacteriocin, lactobin A/cerein 7B family [Bifidobacteriaceae bacterium]|jgi:lactobin A/cerein 7B family class IIb bacteriocin|nr:class IIb bacteriocin, lactobin A/cerein 7B family [Bifidobacteriaceae bacterium]
MSTSNFVELSTEELQDCDGGIAPIIAFAGGALFYYLMFGNPKPAH